MKQLYFLLILTLSFGVYSQGIFTYNFDATTNTTGFKTAILLTHEKRYVDEIRERIIKSIEVLKEEEK